MNCRREFRRIEAFTLTIEADKRNLNSLNNRALAWRHLGVVVQALADFDESLKLQSLQSLQPLQPEVLFLKGQTHFELELDSFLSEQNLTRPLELQPDDSEAQLLRPRWRQKLAHQQNS